MSAGGRVAKWKQYQEDVATLLRSLGFVAVIEAKITGARGVHTIDVHATHAAYGFTIAWIVECKYWNKAVSKEKVLVLSQIAADIGADRAFLLSESGFQSGAVTASKHTNVMLTSLPDLRDSVQEELIRNVLVLITQQVYVLEKRAQALFSPGLYWRPDGLGEQVLDLLARAYSLKTDLLPEAQAGQFPVHLLGDAAPCPDMPTFLTRAEQEILAIGNALEQAIIQSQKVSPIVPAIARDFSTAVLSFLDSSEHIQSATSDAQHEKIHSEALVLMRTIGDNADSLRLLLSPTSLQRLRAVMRALIDGPYLLLVSRSTTDDWLRAKADVIQCLRAFQDHLTAAGDSGIAWFDESTGAA
jgi:hypothetical protein